jgi:hypothetical protein
MACLDAHLYEIEYIVCFLIKEPRPVDLGLKIQNVAKFRKFDDVYWQYQPTLVHGACHF